MNNATVAIVTESWLTDSVPSTAISIGQSFNVFCKDRPTPGGGVLACVHSCIPTICLEKIEASDRDSVVTSHATSDSKTFQLHNYGCFIFSARENVYQGERIDRSHHRVLRQLADRETFGGYYNYWGL